MDRTQRPQREDILCSHEMEQRARVLIESHCHFAGRSRLFEFQYDEDVLVVRGNVPTFYLKQVLQTVLKDLEGVRLIDNQVTVDACEGIFGKLPDDSTESLMGIHQ